MGLSIKKLLRKLVCRPEKNLDNDNVLDNDLLEEQQVKSSAQTKKQRRPTTTKRRKAATETVDLSLQRRYSEEIQERNLYTIKDPNGKYLDTLASFNPKPRSWAIAVKLVIFIWLTFITVDGFLQTEPKLFYLATFDHWASVTTVIYLWCSFLCHAKRPHTRKFQSSNNLPNGWHRCTWTLFSIAAPVQLLASLAFWTFEFHGKDLDRALVYHFSAWMFLMVEGLAVNSTPVRINHQWYFFGMVYLFLLWSLIHSYTNIGNPTQRNNHVETLYPFLKWNKAPFLTTFYCLICLLIVNPLVYGFIWLVSLYSFPFSFEGQYRRYLDSAQINELGADFDDN
jgi:hypothetical protein